MQNKLAESDKKLNYEASIAEIQTFDSLDKFTFFGFGEDSDWIF